MASSLAGAVNFVDGGGSTWTVRVASVTPCIGDVDGDGAVDGSDLGALLGNWGTAGPSDLDGNGVVDGADLGTLLAAWGECPRP